MKRTDNNQRLIMNAFKKLGYSVFDVSVLGRGFPDLIVSKNRKNFLIEIKNEKGKFTEVQLKFYKYWQGDIFCIKNYNDLEMFIRNKLKPII
jgi:hypothetical protein